MGDSTISFNSACSLQWFVLKNKIILSRYFYVESFSINPTENSHCSLLGSFLAFIITV